jgi:hypothetical protein
MNKDERLVYINQLIQEANQFAQYTKQAYEDGDHDILHEASAVSQAYSALASVEMRYIDLSS